MKPTGSKLLTNEEQNDLLALLEARFEKHKNRHAGHQWMDIKTKLLANPEKLWSVWQMEKTGGEPDVIGQDSNSGEFLIVDCSPETPKGRTAVCYDREGWESRKEHRPKSTAVDLANEMGIELLTEDEYCRLQEFGEFDLKTSSWVKTPADFRKRGGALFGDRRFGRVFIYHNGAQSYYSVRAFRGILRL